jgi:anti-anti-sigma factor
MSGDGHLTIETSVDGGTANVRLIGELDLDGTDKATEALVGHAGTDVNAVVVDASGLTFLDSSGLRVLLQAREQLKESNVALSLENATGPVQRVLEMTGTLELLSGS